MNHKITIKNLGPIKDIKDFEVKKINLLIGKSASGKSTMAKAIFLFNFIFENEMLFSRHPESFFMVHIVRLFHEFFPQYREYKIKYKYTNDLFINIEIKENQAHVRFSSKLSGKFKKHNEEIIKFNEMRQLMILNDKDKILRDFGIAQSFFDSIKKDLGILKTIFIPATRSVVFDFDRSRLKMLNEQRSFGKKNLSTDFLETMSKGDIALKLFSEENINVVNQFEKPLKDFEKIIRGSLKKEGGQLILITGNNNKQSLPINQLSSGQKEAIPILMFLQNISDNNKEVLLFIEEPEAHLFPKEQILLFEQIIAAVNKTNSKVFITTHSPFLLLGANDLITAEEMKYKKLEKMFISFEDIQAHKLENGKNESIKDEEDCLISSSYIDKVTHESMKVFEDILENK